jgi:hypothetical protein
MQPEKQTKKHEKPLSLHPMTFDEALDKLLKAKPNKKVKPIPIEEKKHA